MNLSRKRLSSRRVGTILCILMALELLWWCLLIGTHWSALNFFPLHVKRTFLDVRFGINYETCLFLSFVSLDLVFDFHRLQSYNPNVWQSVVCCFKSHIKVSTSFTREGKIKRLMGQESCSNIELILNKRYPMCKLKRAKQIFASYWNDLQPHMKENM